MKRIRQQRILDIIRDNRVETQEELQSLLEKAGFAVTQATISRDIKELKLIKAQSADGIYRYVSGASRVDDGTSNYTNILSHSLISIDHAMNDVVIKCRVGTAQAACAAIDNMELATIVGTIAGDDTIFIITRSEQLASVLCEQLGGYIR